MIPYTQLAFGVQEPLPLRGFPPGRSRIRMRTNDLVRVYIRPPGGGIREFIVTPRDGAWWPAKLTRAVWRDAKRE